MQTPQFQRRVEDFICEHCGHAVQGSGYTNHCPNCLWSKHVDVNPGDRAASCLGQMEPVRLEGSSPEYLLVHRCSRCGFERRNKLVKGDNESALIAIAQKRQMRNN